MPIPVENDWKPILQTATESDSYQALREFLVNEYNQQTIFPEMNNIWKAFEWTPYQKVKVVILGQDPYHGVGKAHGLSFSVQPGVRIPPSLVNIYKELESDLGIPRVQHGYLKHWADEGVLMLNTVLTVRSGQAHSHRGKGWEEVTDFAIKELNKRDEPMVFILWGGAAKRKISMIDERKHTIISSPHPSPLSAYRGFFGSKPFSKANQALEQMGEKPVDWQLPLKVQ